MGEFVCGTCKGRGSTMVRVPHGYGHLSSRRCKVCMGWGILHKLIEDDSVRIDSIARNQMGIYEIVKPEDELLNDDLKIKYRQ